MSLEELSISFASKFVIFESISSIIPRSPFSRSFLLFTAIFPCPVPWAPTVIIPSAIASFVLSEIRPLTTESRELFCHCPRHSFNIALLASVKPMESAGRVLKLSISASIHLAPSSGHAIGERGFGELCPTKSSSSSMNIVIFLSIFWNAYALFRTGGSAAYSL